MNKILKNTLIIVNLLALGALLLALFIPSHQKKVKYSNTDVSGLNKVGIITDKRDIQLSFDLYNEEFYGICLYFAAEGEDEGGEIICTLKYAGQEIASETVQVKELFAKMRSSSLGATELFSGNGKESSGTYTLLLQGSGISPETKISLYGNDNAWKYVRIENNAYQEYYGPLYLLEVGGEEHPHIWSMAFLLTLSLLFSYLIYTYRRDEGKRSGAVQNNKEI